MAPEYGATCGFFPIDEETLKYLKFSGRDDVTLKIVEQYAKEQGLWASEEIEFTNTISLDLNSVVPSISGLKDLKIRFYLLKQQRVLIKLLKKIQKEKFL